MAKPRNPFLDIATLMWLFFRVRKKNSSPVEGDHESTLQSLEGEPSLTSRKRENLITFTDFHVVHIVCEY
jgi:hypothetical protein